MKMSKIGKSFVIFLCLAFLMLPMLFFMPRTAFAEDFMSETRSDENFSMQMQVTSRENSSLPLVTQKDPSEKITYLCFQWRDLKLLHFHFSQDNRSLKDGRYSFKVTHSPSDVLTSVFVEDPEVLYEGNVGDFINLDLFYNIDSDIKKEDLTEKDFAGHDFGLYKFDFVYSKKINEEMKDVSLGAIYVAVLPDTNTEEILRTNSVQIYHSVSSSNQLVNIFNLSLSGTALKYVRPDLISWVAYGTGTDNVKYCLTQQMKDADPELANCMVIWEKYINQNGTTFTLDTNEIEGIWQAYCSIKDTSGNEVWRFEIEGLSTIKVQPKNYVWLILLILGIILALLLTLALVIVFVMKKKEKVW